MGNRGLRPLGRMDRDYVAAFDAQSDERVGEASALGADLAEGVLLDVAFVILIEERGFVAQIGMAIDAIDGDVIVGGDVPAMTRAGVGDRSCPLHGLFTEPYRGHDAVLRFGARRL